MKKRGEKFHFKKFAVSHLRSSMKVGVDGVLIGAWATDEGERILDAGCGSGLISLMMAQRNYEAHVMGIDIDEPSIEESISNFSESPWSDRLKAVHLSFDDLISSTDKGAGFDLIVSNPPFFDSGVKELDDSRKLARHQGSLSPEVLIRGASQLLNKGGRLAMIVPIQFTDSLIAISKTSLMQLERKTVVKYNETTSAKRVMLEFRLSERSVEVEDKILIMFDADGFPTSEYRELCGAFYLKF